jgi:hypothetical protein
MLKNGITIVSETNENKTLKIFDRIFITANGV